MVVVKTLCGEKERAVIVAHSENTVVRTIVNVIQ